MIKKTVLHTAAFNIITQVVLLAVNIVIIRVIAERLGVALWGHYTVLLNITILMYGLTEFGSNTIVFRELCLADEKTRAELWSTMVMFRTIFLLCNSAIFIAIGVLSGGFTFPELGLMIIFMGLNCRSMYYRYLFEIPFRIRSETIFISVVAIAELLLTGAVMSTLPASATIEDVLWRYAAVAVVSFIVFLMPVLKHHWLVARYNRDSLKYMLRESIPTALQVFLLSIAARVDIFFLNNVGGDFANGVYAIGARFVIPIFYFIAAVNMSVAPRFVEAFRTERAKASLILQDVTTCISFVGMAVVAVFFLNSAWLIKLFLGEAYVAHGRAVIPYVAGTSAMLLNIYCVDALTQLRAQKKTAFGMFILLVVLIVGDSLFIPAFGVWGASLVRTAAEMIVVTYFLFSLHSLVRFLTLRWLTFQLLGAVLFTIVAYLVAPFSIALQFFSIALATSALIYYALSREHRARLLKLFWVTPTLPV